MLCRLGTAQHNGGPYQGASVGYLVWQALFRFPAAICPRRCQGDDLRRLPEAGKKKRIGHGAEGRGFRAVYCVQSANSQLLSSVYGFSEIRNLPAKFVKIIKVFF